MKRCPVCQREYSDESLSYCLEDGSFLSGNSSESSDMAATIIMPDPRITVPERQETFRHAPVSPQPFTTPPPTAWSPAAAQPARPFVKARQGRGVAIASLILAIVSFALLGFCIVAGASNVEATLIGGIFLFSVVLAFGGAIAGIVAISKSSKDTGPQNSKALSVVALVLNGLFLLISVVFLVLGAVANSGK
jgi:hypothetical protein